MEKKQKKIRRVDKKERKNRNKIRRLEKKNERSEDWIE